MDERGKPALENSLAQGLKKGKTESIIDLISESGCVPEAVLDLVYAQKDAEALTSCLKPATKSDSMKSFLKNLTPCTEGEKPMTNELTRCDWAAHDILNQEYHDNEWGKPVHDDRTLFKMLILEGMQAGLSWITILKKREAFLKAFDDFDPAVISTYGNEKIEELMQNAGIIRNRLKINAAITNARAYFVLCEKYGSLDRFLWAYVNNNPVKNAWEAMSDVPARTPLAEKISKDLKNLGFKFVGPTIIYAYMQSVGLVNDHLTSCFCYERKEQA